jgi:diacylglycerol kinase family enzyme
MFAYFIDDWVYTKAKRKLDRLDLLITQHAVSGRKIRLNRLIDFSSSIKESIGQGAKTLVAVGNDTTASRLLNHVVHHKDEKAGNEHALFSFAYVPIEQGSKIGTALGLSTLTESIRALAAHRTKIIDLGVLNDRHYFITAAVFPKKASLAFLSYSVSSLHREHQISVCNANIYAQEGPGAQEDKRFNTTDGILEAVIAHRPARSLRDRLLGRKQQQPFVAESIFPVRAITIKGRQKTMTVIADAEKQLTAPIEVKVAPKALQVVIGGSS